MERTDVKIPGLDLPLMSVSQTRGVVRRSEITDAPQRAETLDHYKVCRTGDIVFNKMSIRGGAMGLAKEDGLITYHYEVMRPRPEADPDYVVYLMKSDYFMQQMILRERGIGAGGAASVRTTEVPFKILRTIPVHAPERHQQQAISSFLDRETEQMDAMIAAQEDLVEGLKNRRFQAITEVINEVAAGLGDSPASHTPLKHAGRLQTGLTLGKSYPPDTPSYPYIRVANVQLGRLNLDEVKEIQVPESVAAQARLNYGDVLMTEGGDRAALGRGTVWRDEIPGALHQNHIFAFRPFSQLRPEYLAFVLESAPARIYFESTRRQTTNLSATSSTIALNFRFPMPSLAVQDRVISKIEETLDRMDRMIAAAQESVNLIRERRTAVITAAVTGRLDPATGIEHVTTALENA
ncbi:hypothetical protein CXZ05_20745 [Arthrobacter sp. AFG20]|nr:hypothetical protein CXZ05_20745 [Arthrobacter sp. AFG20]